MFLHDFVTNCLQNRNAGEPFAVEFDVPLYRAPHDYVVPSVPWVLRRNPRVDELILPKGHSRGWPSPLCTPKAERKFWIEIACLIHNLEILDRSPVE